MTVNYWLLSVALVLIWLPRQWLRFGGKVITGPRRRPEVPRDERHIRDVSLHARVEFAKPRNWIDFFRAIAGSLAVAYLCFDKIPGAPRSADTKIFVIETAVFVIAVLIQTIRLEGRFALVAPVFFILGLSFGLIGWQAALFACIAIWTLNLVLPNTGLFLFVFAALEVGFGLLLSRMSPGPVIVAAALAILPVVFSAASKRPLVRLNKKKRTIRR